MDQEPGPPDTTAEALDELLDPETGAVERADVALAAKAGEARHHPVVRALGALSEAADQPPAYALSGAVAAWGLVAGDRRLLGTGARMLVAVTLAIAAKSAIKASVARTRPHKLLDEGHYERRAGGPVEGAWSSFPSGHTADAVAMGRAVARRHREVAPFAYGAAALAAAVQVPRGAHYPLDVAAGAAIGWGAEALADLAVGWAEEVAAGGTPPPDAPRRVDPNRLLP